MPTLDKVELVSEKAPKEQNKVVNVTRSQTMRTMKQCTLVKPKLSKTPLPLTGLVSFPGTGNTWTRHLIQQATGRL